MAPDVRSNLLQDCEIGLKLAAAGVPLGLELVQDSLTKLGNGVIVQGNLCQMTMTNCLISQCKRIGLHALRGANVKLRQCQIANNGRGVVVTGSNAQIHSCSFEGNTGWAVRFEGAADEDPGTSSDVFCNKFCAPSKGNAGRKRVRVDTRSSRIILKFFDQI